MRRIVFFAVIGLAVVFMMTGIACAQGQGPQGAPGRGCQDRFASMDSDHDGKLSKEEFMAAPHRGGYPEQMFKAMDPTGRGYVTVQEFCSGKGKGRGQGQGKNP